MKILEDTLNFFIDETKNTRIFDLPKFLTIMEDAFQKSGFRDERKDNEQKNILVMRLDGIGDNVLSSGFLRELRRNYPSAYITLIVNPTVYNLVELCPYVNEVFPITYNENLIFWLNGAIKLCREQLWRRHFDICFHPRWDIAYCYEHLLGFISGAKERIGYSTKVYPAKEKINAGYDLFLTKSILNPPNVIHETERNLYILKALGLNVQDTKNEVWFNHEDILAANELIMKTGGGIMTPLIAICNGAGALARVYPPQLLLQALKLIADKNDCTYIYIGAKKFIEFGNFLKQALGNRLIDLSGKTTLRETCAVVSKTSMYIGADTGTMHIAAASQVPVIMLGHEAADYPKNYLSMCKRFSPWQTPTKILQPPYALSPCSEFNPRSGCAANSPHCITQISPQNIADAFDIMKKITYNSK
ncbi:MAG: glycosyltransferase family 9 protein [Selenomonadaceae bacterium]|nr:glycosyltransferase family 9 protein [Selenomonadaceae bacterium]